jgi:sulfur carrier protein
MRLKVNGETREYSHDDARDVASLLRAHEAPERGVAVALNGHVVPRAQWNETLLQNGDDLEIIRAVQGG